MVRSHALYPIELRAHSDVIASLNYNGNRIVSTNLIAGFAGLKIPESAVLILKLEPRIRAECRAGCGNRGLIEIAICIRFVILSKSCRPRAKPTRAAVLWMYG